MSAIETAVSAAVAALVEQHGPLEPAQAHAALWPYVRAAAAPYAPRSAPAPAAAAKDRRVRRWQYVARFWDAAGELIGETEPEVMEGTGSVPDILSALAVQLHDALPDALCAAEVKARLPQLRNNLGRGSRAVLRIPYTHAGEQYTCQMDIHRLEG